jgi:peptidoglycan/LPS O-acetylase OafA/YrhL
MIRKINILEAVRGGAALYVFLGHFIISLIVNKNSLFLIPFRFGQEAVILFFLMSGFVIELSHKKNQFLF